MYCSVISVPWNCLMYMAVNHIGAFAPARQNFFSFPSSFVLLREPIGHVPYFIDGNAQYTANQIVPRKSDHFLRKSDAVEIGGWTVRQFMHMHSNSGNSFGRPIFPAGPGLDCGFHHKFDPGK